MGAGSAMGAVGLRMVDIRGDGQVEDEAGTAACRSFGADLAVVGLDHRAAQAEAQPQPVRLGGPERVEHALGMVGGQADATIAYAEADPLALTPGQQRQTPVACGY